MKRNLGETETKVTGKPSLKETIAALHLITDDAIPANVYYGLSDLRPSEIAELKPIWDQLSVDFRQKLLARLAETSESNIELDYRELGLHGLNDDDAKVRAASIDLLSMDESSELMTKLIDLSQWDEDFEVRALAASALGRFILLGEYEEIPEHDAVRAQDAVISLLTNDQEELEVRRRALEAIANSSHEIVNGAIEEAYQSGERLMQVSSIYAMGRTCDRRWRENVIKEMGSTDSEMRYEAVRAAGELQLEESVMRLGEIAIQDEHDISEAAVWSLGEIGGHEALRILTALAEDAQDMEDNDMAEMIEDAISNATLMGELIGFDLDGE